VTRYLKKGTTCVYIHICEFIFFLFFKEKKSCYTGVGVVPFGNSRTFFLHHTTSTPLTKTHTHFWPMILKIISLSFLPKTKKSISSLDNFWSLLLSRNTRTPTNFCVPFKSGCRLDIRICTIYDGKFHIIIACFFSLGSFLILQHLFSVIKKSVSVFFYLSKQQKNVLL